MGWPAPPTTASTADVDMESPATVASTPSLHMRNLVNECFPVFEALAQRSRSTHPAELRPFVLAASKQYRAAMRTCANDMDTKQLDTEADLVHIVKASLALLHLCEILYLDATNETVLAYAFAEWIQEHYAAMEIEDMDMTFFELQTQLGTSVHNVDLPPKYWPTIVQLILAGHGRKAWELLSLYSHANYALATLEPLRQVLMHMPSQSSDSSWPAWHDACRTLAAGDLAKDMHFKMILHVLTHGGADAADATPWYMQAVARCVLEDPKVHLSRTAQCTRLVTHLRASLSPLGPFEETVVSLLEFDLSSALEAVQRMCAGDFPFFPAHLMDLLSHAGHVARSEAFVLAYVDALLVSADPNATLLIAYLETCPLGGGPVLLSLLDAQRRSKTLTDFKAEKLLLHAQTYGLRHFVKQLALDRGAYWTAKGRVGTAMTWLLRARDAVAIDGLCEANWRDATRLHHIADVLEASEQADATAITAFTVAYHELLLVFSDVAELSRTKHVALAQVQQEAAKRLGMLCRSCDIPTSMWPTILSLVDQLVPLQPPVFTSSDLYAVLQAIQDQKLRFVRLSDDKKTATEGAVVAASLGVQKQIALCLAKALVLDV
ncbi:Nup85 Nucleoporin [Saprolegnia diclina VS20]|uniref:Nuclear pore complex protein Nup85 n=1 Tax=Saprolegnia diclina (strain VS20) TaxID=1156394 RepID=T0QV48_SAPDV|nr:Nup85 Nucleoporin [Saprolegnia diclina VS20]EQC42074.1 Nup85 Nucleoporin [Saprolegnia diclina VS20]|eukprot:XP_008604643.1 Nup85 Nucleoporin [Saprolegnia diclina VS20]